MWVTGKKPIGNTQAKGVIKAHKKRKGLPSVVLFSYIKKFLSMRGSQCEIFLLDPHSSLIMRTKNIMNIQAIDE